MITPGQTLENPVTGERFTFTHTAASTDGELLAFDFALRPGGGVPIPHVHPAQTERFEVVHGRMRFRAGLRTRVLGPGDVLEVAAGVMHSFANAGEKEARLRVEVRPALAMEEMFAEVVAMAQSGRMTRRGLPRNPLELAALARRYDQEAHAPLLSVGVQRLLLAPLVFAERHRRGAGVAAALAGTARLGLLGERSIDIERSIEMQDLTLVVGGTGKTGRRVAERLKARGVPVRVGSRAGEPPFDWEDRTTWEPALPGARAAYVSFFPDLTVPGAPAAIAAFAELAVASGAPRLVLLSGRGEAEAQEAERVLQASGAELTVVRCSWFMQNFDEGYLREPVLAGEVALPVGDVAEPFVDADDIADVAAAALTEGGHAGEVYELTGPRLLTFAQATEEIARATGRPVRFLSVPMEAYAAAATAEGVPEDVVELLCYLFGEVLDGRNAHLTDGVQRALGREPRDFRDFARRAAAAARGPRDAGTDDE